MEARLVCPSPSTNPLVALKTKLIAWFKEPAAIPVMEDTEAIEKTYKNWRVQIFSSCFVGYIVFYLCKKNISAALPAMGISLGYSNTELGLLGSTLYLTYAFGKFINGLLADNANVRVFLPFALAIVGIANLLLAVSSLLITPGQMSFFGLPSATVLLWVMAFLWGMNGWFQSMGFPAIAKSLCYWFSNKERGITWSVWSTSHQIGTTISLALSSVVIASIGWQAAFYIPGFIALVSSFILFATLRDRPSTLGLPDIDAYREPEYHQKMQAQNAENQQLSYGQIFKKYILCNPTLWLLAFANVFVYVIRFGTEDWLIKYLMEAKGNSQQIAGLKLSFLPLCGIVGSISCGFISDKVFGGRRAPVNIVFLIGVACAVWALHANASGPNSIDALYLAVTHQSLTSTLHLTGGDVLDIVYLGLMGLFTYGPQVLIGGICAVEASSKDVASASTGFAGCFGYLGAVLSGVGTGMLIDRFQWDGAIYFWIFSAVACILLCLPMLNQKAAK